jgi:glucose/arabinose dehydrogenase
MRLFLSLFLTAAFSNAAQQSDFYLREEIPLPPGEVMEIGSIALMPDHKVAVTTRRGDLWICSGAYGDDISKVTWKKYAQGLHEPLGMFWQDGALWLTQRPEVSKIKDIDGDGLADTFETICSDWGIKGDYHEYAFGSTPDREGNIWVVLCLTGSFTAESDWRGWCLRVTPDGKMIPTCSGIRSPGGIGFNAEGDTFYTDNQGPWNGSSSLKWLKPGSFQGNPTANKYAKLTNFPAPPEVANRSRILTERTRHPEFIPPAVVMPHGKVGQSPTGIACDLSNGKFGPWAKQLYVGEQTHSQVQRVSLEKVNGLYQGAVFHFLEGFEAGLIPVRLDQEAGLLFVGGSNRGWASRGNKPYTFERVKWTGKTPFEIETMTATPDGFTLTFTEPVDPTTAADPASYVMDAFTYIYQGDYGSPEVDESKPTVTAAKVAADHQSVRLTVEGLVRGHIHHLEAKGVKSESGNGLWHPEAWYTLNEIPN